MQLGCPTENGNKKPLTYENVKIIWTNISNYIDLLGDWQLCLYWTDWLIKQSDIRSELETYISLKTNKAWILILMGGNKLYEAKILLKEARVSARKFRHHIS